AKSLDKAWGRVQRKRSHKTRNITLVLVGVGVGAAVAVVAIPKTRRWVMGPSGRTISETIEVDVPVSTAYNQWTQFEDFPLFMEGVDDVKQLDHTPPPRGASGAGKRN